MRTTLTISSRGVVTLPAKLREALGLKADDRLIAETTSEGLLLRPAVTLPLEVYTRGREREFDQAEAELSAVLATHESARQAPAGRRAQARPRTNPSHLSGHPGCGNSNMRTRDQVIQKLMQHPGVRVEVERIEREESALLDALLDARQDAGAAGRAHGNAGSGGGAVRAIPGNLEALAFRRCAAQVRQGTRQASRASGGVEDLAQLDTSRLGTPAERCCITRGMDAPGRSVRAAVADTQGKSADARPVTVVVLR